MAKKKTMKYGAVEGAIRTLFTGILEDFRKEMADSMEETLASLEERLRTSIVEQHAPSSEEIDGIVHNAVESDLAAKLADRGFVTTEVLEARLADSAGPSDEDILSRMDEAVARKLSDAGFVTGAELEERLGEAGPSASDVVQKMNVAMDARLVDAGYVTAGQLEERLGEAGPSSGDMVQEMNAAVDARLADAGFVTADQLTERLGEAGPSSGDMVQEMNAAVDARLADAGFVTADQLTERLGAASEASEDLEAKIQATTEQAVGAVLAEEAQELIVRIKQDMRVAVEEKVDDFGRSDDLKAIISQRVQASMQESGLTTEDIRSQMEETVKAAISGAFQSTLFSDAVASVSEGGGGGMEEEAVRSMIQVEGKRVTEEILMREAQGLVKQVKIEVGKVQKQIEVVAAKSGVTPEDVVKIKDEIETSFGEKMSGFFESADFKTLVAGVAEEKTLQLINSEQFQSVLEGIAPSGEAGMLSPTQIKALVDSAVEAQVGTSGGGTGGGGGGGLDRDAVASIVEEVLKPTLTAHVGKFLDEKLPPPEYFESLATLGQVREEIDRRMSGSSAGLRAPSGAFTGSPGDSAVFTNLISRILGSDDLKEMIDDKFKVINNYIKNELVPRVVRKTLKTEGK
jgi:hypothetical protein